jgi:SAM-dependent methyltransferase
VPNYDTAFFKYVNSGAVRSAERMLPLLLLELRVKAVLDVGCGTGAWLSVWQRLGAEVVGIDGSYVDPRQLLIPASAFVAHDLSEAFDLRRRFDLVQCLEVAEHLAECKAETFIQSLVRHGDLILFSAATKGQGGDHHINEQNYDYWRAHFERQGYVGIDYLRPLLVRYRDIEPWYRYNTLLFCAAGQFAQLPASIRNARLAPNRPVRDLSPWPYRMRKRLVGALPVPVATGLAKSKERVVEYFRRSRPWVER